MPYQAPVQDMFFNIAHIAPEAPDLDIAAAVLERARVAKGAREPGTVNSWPPRLQPPDFTPIISCPKPACSVAAPPLASDPDQ